MLATTTTPNTAPESDIKRQPTGTSRPNEAEAKARTEDEPKQKEAASEKAELTKKEESEKQKRDRELGELVSRPYTFNNPFDTQVASFTALTTPKLLNSEDPVLRVAYDWRNEAGRNILAADRAKGDAERASVEAHVIIAGLRGSVSSASVQVTTAASQVRSSDPGSVSVAAAPSDAANTVAFASALEVGRSSALGKIYDAKSSVRQAQGTTAALEANVASTYTLVTHVPSLDAQIDLRFLASQLLVTEGDLGQHIAKTNSEFIVSASHAAPTWVSRSPEHYYNVAPLRLAA